MNERTLETIFTSIVCAVAGLLIGRALAQLGVSWQWIVVIVFFGAIIVGMLIGYALHYRNK